MAIQVSVHTAPTAVHAWSDAAYGGGKVGGYRRVRAFLAVCDVLQEPLCFGPKSEDTWSEWMVL